MKKKILKILGILLLIIVVVLLFNIKTIKRLYATIHLFDEDVIIENFQNMDQIFNYTKLTPSPNPQRIPVD